MFKKVKRIKSITTKCKAPGFHYDTVSGERICGRLCNPIKTKKDHIDICKRCAFMTITWRYLIMIGIVIYVIYRLFA